MGDFVDLMCRSEVSFKELNRQRVRMDSRLALNYFGILYMLCVLAWGLYQIMNGHDLMGSICTTLLIANVYFLQKLNDSLKKNYNNKEDIW